jgi:alkylhydroperoxidase family enzyme
MSVEFRIPLPDLPDAHRKVYALYQPEFRVLFERYMAAVTKLPYVDPVTIELVRLACARQHHCRLCMSVRSANLDQPLVTEDLAAKVDHFERSDLDEAHKVALRFTRAMLSDPSGISDQLVDEVRAVFDDDQIVQLALNINKFSVQKVMVSLGTDEPFTDDPISLVTYKESGKVATVAPLR